MPLITEVVVVKCNALCLWLKYVWCGTTLTHTSKIYFLLFICVCIMHFYSGLGLQKITLTFNKYQTAYLDNMGRVIIIYSFCFWFICSYGATLMEKPQNQKPV